MAIAFGNNAFCALRNDGTVWRSYDLVTWTKTRTGTSGYTYDDIDFYNGRFIAVGTETTASPTTVVLSSIDGTEWLQYDTNISNTDIYPANQSLANGNNMSVIVNGNSGTTYQAIYSYSAPVQNVWASGLYSDPTSIGVNWIMLLGNANVGFYANGHASRTVSLGGYTVTAQSTIVQANNYVYV